MKILIIEDNKTIGRQLVEFLSGHGWTVDYAHNGELGVQLGTENLFDVVLLDLNLPDMDGLAVCQAIKSNAPVTPPVLMVTARDSFEDKAAGFHQGADDYLTKPFDLRELPLRCEALARRHKLHQSQWLEIGELKIDTVNQVVQRADVQLSLTSIGFRIITLLAQAYPNPVSRSFLLHNLWGDDPPETDALKSHIYSLRQAVDKPFDKSILKTLVNIGYKLDL